MLSAVSPAVRTLLPVTAIIWAIFEIRQASQQRSEANPADRGSRVAIRLATLVGVGATIALDRFVTSAMIGTHILTAWIGLVVMWCGIGLRLWSFQTLGRYFTFTVQTSEDQPVISAGPYRVIRHPGYAGALVAVIGIGFVLDNWAALVVLTGSVAAGLTYRIMIEERALARDLGGRYQMYAQHRKRLVPFIW